MASCVAKESRSIPTRFSTILSSAMQIPAQFQSLVLAQHDLNHFSKLASGAMLFLWASLRGTGSGCFSSDCNAEPALIGGNEVNHARGDHWRRDCGTGGCL